MSLYLSLALMLALGIALAVYPLKKNRLMVGVSFLMVAILSYYLWGGNALLTAYREKLAVQALLKKTEGPAVLIEKIKKKLLLEPESTKGWYLLGRLHASLGQWQEASLAFAKANELAPQDIQITMNFVQSLFEVSHRTFNPIIRNHLNAVLSLDPNQSDALAMLAMDSYTEKEYDKAIQLWRKLLNLLPESGDDTDSIRRLIAEAEKINA